LGLEQKGKVVLNPDTAAPLHDGDRVVCIAPSRPAALRL
jgi:K+/H+ antiporter YhaU regulatory subunit KhtT